MNIKIIEKLKFQISEKFIQGMMDRMFMSYYKYGAIQDGFPDKLDAIGCLQLRLEKYKEDGNTEWLMDAANYAMIEFMLPKHPKTHFKATESAESPGRISNDGIISNKEIRKFKYTKEGD